MFREGKAAALKRTSVMKPLVTVLLVLLAVSFGLILIGSHRVAYSVAAGGFIAWLANLCSAWYTFRYMGAAKAKLIVNSMFRAEALKFAIVAIGFFLVIRYAEHIDFLIAMCGFILTYFACVVASYIAVNNAEKGISR